MTRGLAAWDRRLGSGPSLLDSATAALAGLAGLRQPYRSERPTLADLIADGQQVLVDGWPGDGWALMPPYLDNNINPELGPNTAYYSAVFLRPTGHHIYAAITQAAGTAGTEPVDWPDDGTSVPDGSVIWYDCGTADPAKVAIEDLDPTKAYADPNTDGAILVWADGHLWLVDGGDWGNPIGSPSWRERLTQGYVSTAPPAPAFDAVDCGAIGGPSSGFPYIALYDYDPTGGGMDAPVGTWAIDLEGGDYKAFVKNGGLNVTDWLLVLDLP